MCVFTFILLFYRAEAICKADKKVKLHSYRNCFYICDPKILFFLQHFSLIAQHILTSPQEAQSRERERARTMDNSPCSQSESESSLDGAALNNSMAPPSPVSREQLQKRIDSLNQHNKVLKVELDTYKIRVKQLQEENKTLRQASVNIVSRTMTREDVRKKLM